MTVEARGEYSFVRLGFEREEDMQEALYPLQELPSDERDRIAQRYRFSGSHGLILGLSALPIAEASIMELEKESGFSLVRNVKFLDEVAKDKPVLILTSDQKVPEVLKELRQNFGSKMVGEAGWTDIVLDLIVASPQHVTQARHICAVVLDGGIDIPGLNEALTRIESFDEFSGFLDIHCLRHEEMFYPPLVDVSRRFLSSLPEAFDCPGLGDFLFVDQVRDFALSKAHLVSIADWSGVLALLPGLVRGIFQGRTSLVVVQSCRVARTVELLNQFVESHLGLPATRLVSTYVNRGAESQAQLLVGTLDAVVRGCRRPENLGKVAVLELDVLLESGKQQEIAWLLSHAPNASFALHYTSQLWREKWEATLPLAKARAAGAYSLVHACLFVETAGDETAKLHKVEEIFRRLARRKDTEVVCGSEEKAREVVDWLTRLEVPAQVGGRANQRVLAVTYEADRECQPEMVIVFDMPASHGEYLRRCGGIRGMGKHVINLISGNEEELVFLRGLGRELYPLPSDKLERLTRMYPFYKRRLPLATRPAADSPSATNVSGKRARETKSAAYQVGLPGSEGIDGELARPVEAW